jgi:hypothetical protein
MRPRALQLAHSGLAVATMQWPAELMAPEACATAGDKMAAFILPQASCM